MHADDAQGKSLMAALYLEASFIWRDVAEESASPAHVGWSHVAQRLVVAAVAAGTRH